MGSRRICEFSPSAYSPEATPDWRRAAPAKNRPDHLGELTGVAALSLDETVGVGLQGVGESEQEQLPVRRRCQPPALECLEGGVVGGVDIGGTRDRALRYDLFRSRIHDVERGIGGCRNKYSINEILEERKAHVNHSASWLRRDVGVEVRSVESRKNETTRASTAQAHAGPMQATSPLAPDAPQVL